MTGLEAMDRMAFGPLARPLVWTATAAPGFVWRAAPLATYGFIRSRGATLPDQMAGDVMHARREGR